MAVFSKDYQKLFVSMLEEITAFLVDKKGSNYAKGEYGESTFEAIITSKDFDYKEVRIDSKRVKTFEDLEKIAYETLNEGEFISSKDYNLSPDFIVCIRDKDQKKLRALFGGNFGISNKKIFMFIEVKTTARKTTNVKLGQSTSKDLEKIFKVEDGEEKVLSKKELESVKSFINSENINIFIQNLYGLNVGNINKKQINSIFKIRKTKRNIQLLDKDGENIISLETRENKPKEKKILPNETQNDLTKDEINKIKEVWKLFKKVWYKTLEKKSSDELRAAYTYYLIHTEQEIPAHIIKNSYELKIKMDNLRDTIFSKKTMRGAEAKKKMFILLEKVLQNKSEALLLESWEELCLL